MAQPDYFPSMPDSEFQVLIAGGGVVGSSIAYFLAASGRIPPARIGVVEPDPTYAGSSSALSVGGIRQQFSTPENILLSRFGAEFFRAAPEILATEDHRPDLGFVEAGYLFLASPAGLEALRQNHDTQTSLGARVELLPPGEIQARFPWLRTDDLAGGGLGLEGEGWVDPHSLLQALRKKAASLQVSFLQDRVVDVTVDGGRVRGVALASGRHILVDTLVDAAGPRAAEVARMAGIQDLPVHPRKRFVYRFSCRDAVSGAPLTVDPSGVYFRPEGPDFLCGVSPAPDRDPDTFDLDMSDDLFHQVIWPALAHRVPAFEALRLRPSWAGLYAVNVKDRNAILGPHPGLTNFFFANGFSGHGLQHAPGVGRGLSELILTGEYRTLDLSPFHFDRFRSGALIREQNVV